MTDPPNAVLSPCGKWRVHWWLTSAMADSYSSIDVVAMMVEDRATGRNAAIPRDFEDTSLRPIRFLGPRRVLLYSTNENAYYEARFDTAKTNKLARPEDAVDEYQPLVLTSAPNPRGLILGLLSPCVILSFLGAIGMAKGSHYAGALAIFILSLVFAALAAWLCTDRRFQKFDPARGVIVNDVRSFFHHAETQYLVEEFERIEVKDHYYKGTTIREATLTGKRRLRLLDAHRAPEVAARLNLPVAGP